MTRQSSRGDLSRADFASLLPFETRLDVGSTNKQHANHAFAAMIGKDGLHRLLGGWGWGGKSGGLRHHATLIRRVLLLGLAVALYWLLFSRATPLAELTVESRLLNHEHDAVGGEGYVSPLHAQGTLAPGSDPAAVLGDIALQAGAAEATNTTASDDAALVQQANAGYTSDGDVRVEASLVGENSDGVNSTAAPSATPPPPPPPPPRPPKPAFPQQPEFEEYLKSFNGTDQRDLSVLKPRPVLHRTQEGVGEDKGKKRAALVVRTYGALTDFKKEFLLNLTTQLRRREQQYAHDLSPGTDTHYDVWVIYDSTKSDSGVVDDWRSWTQRPSAPKPQVLPRPPGDEDDTDDEEAWDGEETVTDAATATATGTHASDTVVAASATETPAADTPQPSITARVRRRTPVVNSNPSTVAPVPSAGEQDSAHVVSETPTATDVPEESETESYPDVFEWQGMALDNITIGLMEYTTADIVDHFWDTPFINRVRNLIAWAFHEPSILYFEDWVAKHVHGHHSAFHDPSRYDFVWALEDDIFFTGDFGDFFDYYSQTDADLITARFKGYDRWWRVWAGPRSSQRAMKWENVYYSRESVVRFSTTLLDTLRAFMRMNVVLYGEAYAPTVCHQMRHFCATHDLTKDPFYNRELYMVDGKEYRKITPEIYDMVWSDPRFANKWVHGIKRNSAYTN